MGDSVQKKYLWDLILENLKQSFCSKTKYFAMNFDHILISVAINYRLRKHNRTSWDIDHHGRRLIFGDDGIFQNFPLERAKIVVFLIGHSIHVGFSKPRLYFFGADSLTNSQLGKNSEWVGE